MPALAAVCVCAATALVLAIPGQVANPAEPFIAEIERLAEAAGLGLEQVAVTGHRYTNDGDVFDAVDLGHARTLLTFDSRAARARIEQLPWVARASIERVIPDRIEVRVFERVPFAVWRLGSRHLLIDRSGRVLMPVYADTMPNLPRLSGEGAAGGAAALYDLLAARPQLLARVELAERIGGRRWTLRLSGGGAIHLPADNEAAALTLAAQAAAAGIAPDSEIDLRIPGRVLLREKSSEGRDLERLLLDSAG